MAVRNQTIEARFSRGYQRESHLSQSHGPRCESSCRIIYQRTRWRNWYVKSPNFFPTLKLVLYFSDIVTQLTPGESSRMKSIETFGTQDEDGYTAIEIDQDSRDGTTGTHNGWKNTYLILIWNHLELAPNCSASVEDAQADSTTSDKGLSKNQVEELGGEVLYRNPHLTFYITGKLRHWLIEVS